MRRADTDARMIPAMTSGAALFTIAVGAVLAFAVTRWD
jgi:hypothetical protein